MCIVSIVDSSSIQEWVVDHPWLNITVILVSKDVFSCGQINLITINTVWGREEPGKKAKSSIHNSRVHESGI